MARRLTEIYTREVFLAPFKFPRTKKFADLKQMAGAGEDSMMDWENVYQCINPDDQWIELPDMSSSTNIFGTQSEPCDRFNLIAKTEVQAIARSSSAAQSAEASTPNVESCAAQAKRRATLSFDKSRLKDLTDSKGKEKRVRATNWSNDEKETFLFLKLEALEKSEKSWFRFVSEQLRRRREIERTETSCQQQWDLLKKAYKAIRNLHELKSQSEEHLVLFWDMDESARMAMKKIWNEDLKYLPGAFPKEWYDLMEKIIVLRAQVKDTKAIHVGELNREPSISTRANVWPGALDSSTIPPNQALVSSNVLCHDCIKQQSNDKILPDEELMSRIVLLVDKQIAQALMPELLRRKEDNEQKYRENLHAIDAEHSQRLLDKEAEHSQRLQAIEARLLDKEAEHSQRLQATEAELLRRLLDKEAEHSRRLQAIEAELLRSGEEVQKHRKSLLDMLQEEELAASLKLTTLKERKRELA